MLVYVHGALFDTQDPFVLAISDLKRTKGKIKTDRGKVTV